MKCPTCGVEIPDDAAFCPSCGTRSIQSESTCPSCQAPVKPDAAFCANCGSTLGETSPQKSACPACGVETKPGAVFCPNCGANLQAAPAQPPVPPVAPPVYQQPAPAPKKKRGLLIAVVVVVVVALLGVGVYALFGKSIKRATMGPMGAYLQIEGNALKEQAEDLAADIAKYGNKNDSNKGGADLTLKLTPSAGNPDIDPTMAGVLEMLSFNDRFIYDRTGDSPRYFNRLDITAYTDTVLSLETLFAEDQLVINLPDLLDKSILATAAEIEQMGMSFGVDTGSIGPMAGLVTGSGALDLGVNEKALKKTFLGMVEILLDNIDSCELEKGETLTAGSVSAKYDLYDVTISEDSARTIAIELFKLLKDDEDFYNLVAGMQAASSSAYGEEPYVMSYEEYQEEMQDAIDEIEADDSSETYIINQRVYVNSSDEIVGRDLVIEDGSGNVLFNLVYSQPRDGDDEALYLMIDNGDENYSVQADYSYDGDSKTGSGSLMAMGTDLVRMTFQDVRTVSVNDIDRMLGTFQITVLSEESEPTEFTLVLDADGDQLQIDLDMPEVMSISIGYTDLAESDIVFPSYDSSQMVSISDTQGLESLVTPEVQQKMMEIMSMFGAMPSIG